MGGLDKHGWAPSVPTCEWAAESGRLEVLQWMSSRPRWRASSLTYGAAAWGGRPLVLQWAREQGRSLHKDTCAVAAGRGHLPMLQWVGAQGCP